MAPTVIKGIWGRFDTVLCLGFLYHLADPIVFLCELRRLINPKAESPTLIIDTQINPSAVSTLNLRIESDHPSSALPPPGRTTSLVTVPSESAVYEMTRYAGFDCERMDLRPLLAHWRTPPMDGGFVPESLQPYDDRRRAIFVCRALKEWVTG